MAGSKRVSGEKSSLCDGRDSSLWKDSIGCRNAELIWLEISQRSDRRVEPSICKLANKESEPGARAMPAICFRWFDFEA